jgi:hypothetical protein
MSKSQVPVDDGKKGNEASSRSGSGRTQAGRRREAEVSIVSTEEVVSEEPAGAQGMTSTSDLEEEPVDGGRGEGKRKRPRVLSDKSHRRKRR